MTRTMMVLELISHIRLSLPSRAIEASLKVTVTSPTTFPGNIHQVKKARAAQENLSLILAKLVTDQDLFKRETPNNM